MARFKYDEIPDDTGPGLYRFFLMEGATLPGISVDETRLLYVGTTKSKRDRNHFYPDAAKSTLRRTIAAILKNAGKLQVKAYSRGSGSDTAKDAAHSRFTLEVESRLTDWMKNNLEFSFDIFEGTDDEREVKETTAMAKEHPPLNLNKWDNPIGKSLRNLRAICAEEARQNGPIPRSENENVPILLVLASASPRRRELLTQAGFTFQVHPAHIPEDPHSNEDPIAYVVRLAREKAQAVYDKLADQAATVLGADTTVVLDNQILGKPADAADAARMLRLLSGRTHRVITGVAVVTAARTEVAAEVTAVKFLALSDEEIAAYIATGEPMDKAGAYAIQGRAARWIPRIEGDYFNVVGLPLALVTTLLESF